MPEIQIGDKVVVRPMLQDGPPRLGVPHYVKTREYTVINIIGEDVMLETKIDGNVYWKITHGKGMFCLVDGVWCV